MAAAQARCGEKGGTELTVHASPYGVEAHRRIGLFSLDTEREENGIRYTPMLCRIFGSEGTKEWNR